MRTSIDLISVARGLVAAGKGILAADESLPTITKRFQAIGLESTEETRRAYRELLCTTPGLSRYISGVILFEETLHQTDSAGVPLPQRLADQGILPGIKVDLGTHALPFFPGEKFTEGLDHLGARLEEYQKRGARFAKWRAVLSIGPGMPTSFCLKTNARLLALYAAQCQESGVVPMVEPEVLMEGNHTLQQSQMVTRETLQVVFEALAEHRVALERMILKPNMVLPGIDSVHVASVEEVARATVESLRQTVPAAVPGITFLSGGQTEQQATAHLNAINKLGLQPWELSFSFGRALQDPVLKIWRGDKTKVEAAQKALLHRAWLNSLARFGLYEEALENQMPPEERMQAAA